MAAVLTAVLRARKTAMKMTSRRESAAKTSTLRSRMTIVPTATMNGMEAINRKGALRNKGASGMGLNMVDNEGWDCGGYANTQQRRCTRSDLGFSQGLCGFFRRHRIDVKP